MRKLPTVVGLGLWTGAAAGLALNPASADGHKVTDLPSPGVLVVKVSVTTSNASLVESYSYKMPNPYSETGETYDASRPSLRKPDQAQVEHPQGVTLAERVTFLMNNRKEPV